MSPVSGWRTFPGWVAVLGVGLALAASLTSVGAPVRSEPAGRSAAAPPPRASGPSTVAPPPAAAVAPASSSPPGAAPAAAVPTLSAAPIDPALGWRELQAGLAYRIYRLTATPSCGDGRLHALRIEPERARLVALTSTARRDEPHTAAEWCRTGGLVAAINLGMFQADRRSNVGYARIGEHVNSRGWNRYLSALGFDPTRPGLAPALMVDLDEAGARERLADYGTVVQNLRLIKAPGVNRWTAQPRRWSEAAVAQDDRGRLLFLFTRSPFAMADLNRLLLGLDLGVVRAMHVEGGPEASFSLHAGGIHVDLAGGYETGFAEGCAEGSGQWAIPNVLGVAAGGAIGTAP